MRGRVVARSTRAVPNALPARCVPAHTAVPAQRAHMRCSIRAAFVGAQQSCARTRSIRARAHGDTGSGASMLHTVFGQR
eukprot:9805179-Alexandrium_andersonii.AAC.1